MIYFAQESGQSWIETKVRPALMLRAGGTGRLIFS